MGDEKIKFDGSNTTEKGLFSNMMYGFTGYSSAGYPPEGHSGYPPPHGYPMVPGSCPPRSYPSPGYPPHISGPYPPYIYSPPSGCQTHLSGPYPPHGYHPLGYLPHASYPRPHGPPAPPYHGYGHGSTIGPMLAGGAAGYGAHHLLSSHGHHQHHFPGHGMYHGHPGHHGMFKHGKFKRGKFWKHGKFGGKFKKWK